MIASNTFSYAFWASSIIPDNDQSSAFITVGVWDYEVTLSTFTDFEDVSKGAYASDEITTNGETWLFDDALIGTLSSDLKNDAQSARLRNGVIETTFATTNLKSLTFYAGRFGTDALSTLSIELSSDRNTWQSYDSFSVSTSLQYYNIVFTESGLTNLGYDVDDALYVRFTSNDNNRINIDDVSINYTASLLEEYLFVEDFETASKAAYAIDTITINNLDWELDDALIGSLNNDQKNGSSSIRLRNGYVETLFKVRNIEEISFYYGNYNQQNPSGNLTVNVSLDGMTWHIIDTLSSSSSFVMYTINITDTLLNPFGLSTSDALYIRLSSNDQRRINIDDFSIICLGESNFNVE